MSGPDRTGRPPRPKAQPTSISAPLGTGKLGPGVSRGVGAGRTSREPRFMEGSLQSRRVFLSESVDSSKQDHKEANNDFPYQPET